MKNVFRKFLICLGVGAIFASSQAHATPLTFDDYSSTPAGATLSLYNGLQFTGTSVLNTTNPGFSTATFLGLPQSVVSGNYVAASASTMAFSSVSQFSLVSGYFTAYMGTAPSRTLTAMGYLNNVLVDTQTFTITNTGPAFISFASTFSALTSVTFQDSTGGVALDNLTINPTSQLAAVPEPASLALLGLGLLGLGFRRRSRSA